MTEFKSQIKSQIMKIYEYNFKLLIKTTTVYILYIWKLFT